MVPATFADLPTSSRGASVGVWTRRVMIALFCVVMALALADVFGQKPSSSVASGPSATLRLSAPRTVRGGLFFQSRVEIRARQAIASPRLVLDDGWFEGMQVNSIEPAPALELSRNGRVVLTYDKLEPGDLLRVWLQFEVDPTNVGHRAYGLELDDAAARVARVSRSITVLP